MTLLLSRKGVQSLLTMQDAIQIVEEAFRQFAVGLAIQDVSTARLALEAKAGVEFTF